MRALENSVHSMAAFQEQFVVFFTDKVPALHYQEHVLCSCVMVSKFTCKLRLLSLLLSMLYRQTQEPIHSEHPCICAVFVSQPFPVYFDYFLEQPTIIIIIERFT